MEHKMKYFENNNRTIRANIYVPDTPKFAVLVMHGMAEHDGRYAHFAQALKDNGGYVMTYNHRGHGEDARHLGDIESMAALVDDARFLADKLPQHLPKIIIGHSMGSVVARHLMRVNAFKSFIIIGTLSKLSIADFLSQLFVFPIAKLSPNSRLKILNYLGLSVHDHAFQGDMKNRWLTQNMKNVTSFNDDPYCGFNMTTHSIYESLKHTISSVNRKSLSEIKNRPRILFVAGTDDAIANHGKDIYKLADIYRNVASDVVIHMYPGSRHEVLNEQNQIDVFKNIIDWIDSND